MTDKDLEDLSKSFDDLDAASQFSKSFDLVLSEDQIDRLFAQLLSEPKKNLWALRGLAVNYRISLGCLEKCIYSPIDTHLFAIQNPRLDQLKGSRELPIHQIEAVRNALGQRDVYQSLIDECSASDTSQERFAELAALNLTSSAYIAFWHDRESAESRREDLFFGSDEKRFNFSEDAENVLQEFVELDSSPEYPELLWRVQANRNCKKFPSAKISYLGEHLEFENLRDLLELLPARLALVISGEGENYDESWPMAQMEYSTFDLDIETALKMAHPSTPNLERVAKINELIEDSIYDPNELDAENNWITLLSAILYTQDTELLESIAQGDNDLWKLAVILNPSVTPEIVELADDFECEFSLGELPEVDFFEGMVEYAIQTHDLEAANHWQSLAEVSDNQDANDEEFEDEEDDEFEDE
jgi:hypothetical protein